MLRERGAPPAADRAGAPDASDADAPGGALRPASLSDAGAADAKRTRPPAPLAVTGTVVSGDVRRLPFQRTIGVVQVADCFAVIKEYQEIGRNRLDPNGAMYHFYLRKANQRFLNAVEVVGREKGIDLVIEAGGASGGTEGQIVDLTDSVLQYLRRK